MVVQRIGRIAASTPNWRTAVSVSYEFDTVVMTSRDGTEQREARRQTARVDLNFRSWFRPDAATRMLADIHKDQNEPFVLPVTWRTARIDVGCAIGESAIYLDGNAPFWAVPGTAVILFNGQAYEVSEIEAVDADEILLFDPVASEQVSGGTITFAYRARAQDTIDFVAETTDLLEATLKFDVVPGSDTQVYPQRSDVLFEGLPVFLEKPNWNGPPRIKITEEREIVDAGFGVSAVGTPVAYSTMQNRLTFNPRTREATELMIAHFLWAKGRRGSFFMPTWQRDLRIIGAGALATESAFTVEGADVHAGYAGSPVYNMVMVTFPDGQYQVNRIASMALDTGNTVVTFVDPWEQDLPATCRVSWCPLVRSTVDRLEVNWLTTDVAEIEMTIQTLVNPAPVEE